MTKRFVWTGLLFSATAFLVLFFGANAQAKKFTLHCAMIQGPVNSVFELYEEKQNKARAEAAVKMATGHDLEIIMHKQLVKASDVLDAVRDGRVDIGVQGAMYRGDLTVLNAMAFPVILPYEKCPVIEPKLLPIYEEVLRDDFDVVMLGMGYWPRQMLLSRKPAATFEDLKGVKFRCHSYDLLQLTKSAGGSPVEMPYMEVYLALQRGAIDGAVSSMSGMAGQKWFEVAKHVNWWPFGTVVYFNIANKKAWSKLPEGVQRAIKEVYMNSGHETWTMSDLEDQRSKAEYTEKYGVTHHFPTEAEINQLKKMVGPVIADWKKRAGPRAGQVMNVFNEVLGTNY